MLRSRSTATCGGCTICSGIDRTWSSVRSSPTSNVSSLGRGPTGIGIDERLVDACQLIFDRFLAPHSPKSICVHSNQGPYSLVQATLIGPQFSGARPVVTRHIYDSFELPAIIPGVKNRWIYYPGAVSSNLSGMIDATDMSDPIARTLYGLPLYPGYDTGKDLLDSIIRAVCTLKEKVEKEKRTEWISKTSLDLYGQSRNGLIASHKIYQAAYGSDPSGIIHQHAKSTVPGVFEKSIAVNHEERRGVIAGEIQCNEWLASAMPTTGSYPKGKEWKNLVRLLLWQVRPGCDCCGWTPEDHAKETVAGLTPREAQLSRALRD